MKANKIKRRKVEYIWEEHIPYGMMTIFAGPPGKGKSTLGLKVVADVSQYEPCIVSSYEEPPEESIVPKLEAAGAKMENVEILRMRFPGHTKKLEQMIKDEGYKLLLMDTASDNTNASIYHVKDIRMAFEDMVEGICRKQDLAILMITHTVKKVDLKADPLNAIGGSQGGLAAMCRCAYLFGYTPKDIDERALVQLKCNVDYDRPGLLFELDVHEFDDGITAPFLISKGNTGLQPHGIFTAQPRPDPQKLEDAAEWLVEALYAVGGAQSEEKIKEAARARGMSSRVLRRTADTLGIERVEGIWKLPPVPLDANVEEGDEREQ